MLNWWEEAGSSVASGPESVEDELAKDGLVSLDGEFLNHDIVRVTARIEGLQTPVLGMAFHLKYEAEALTFLRYDPGSFLEAGGDPFYLVMASKDSVGAESGELIFGETLRRNDDFPIGDGVVAEFYFQELAPSDEAVYEFVFENGVVSTLDTVRQDLAGIEFVDLVLNEAGVGEETEAGIEVPGAGNTYAANASGVFEQGALGGSVIWLVLGIGILFSASFWYLFKAKTKRKFAHLD